MGGLGGGGHTIMVAPCCPLQERQMGTLADTLAWVPSLCLSLLCLIPEQVSTAGFCCAALSGPPAPPCGSPRRSLQANVSKALFLHRVQQCRGLHRWQNLHQANFFV